MNIQNGSFVTGTALSALRVLQNEGNRRRIRSYNKTENERLRNRPLLVTCFVIALISAVAAGGGAPPADRVRDAVRLARALQAQEAKRLFQHFAVRKDGVQRRQAFDVLHDDLDLRIDPRDRTITGTVAMRFSPTATLGKLMMRLHEPLQVTSALLDGRPAQLKRNGSDLIFTLTPPLAPQSIHTLTIAYGGAPPEGGGLGGGMMFDIHQNVPSATTLSEPFGSSNWWPCVDDLSDKLTVDMKLTVPPGMLGASNGKLVATTPNPDGWTTYHWSESYPLSNYLVSANVTNYAAFSDSYRSLDGKQIMPLRYYVYPEDLQRAMINFKRVPEMIRLFAGMVGEYPFIKEKYGMVAFPWGGGMEHQTLTSVGASQTSTTGNPDILFAHELAHQWFGDEVTCATWNDIWLNEGFATYFQHLWALHEFGGKEGEYMARFYDDGLYDGSMKGSVYMFQDANPFVDAGAIYDKGAWVLHMLKYVMGKERFFRALRVYRAAHAYSNASTADLQSACESTYGKSLAWFFDEWVYTPFRPIYHVAFTQAASALTVTIRQTQPHRIAHRTSGADVYIMPVQLTLHFSDGASQVLNVLNDSRVQTFTFTVSKVVASVGFDEDHRILNIVK